MPTLIFKNQTSSPLPPTLLFKKTLQLMVGPPQSSRAVLLEQQRVVSVDLVAGVRAATPRVEHRHDAMPVRLTGRRSTGSTGRRSTDLAELRAEAGPDSVQNNGLSAEELHLVAAPRRHHARGGCVDGWVGGVESELFTIIGDGGLVDVRDASMGEWMDGEWEGNKWGRRAGRRATILLKWKNLQLIN